MKNTADMREAPAFIAGYGLLSYVMFVGTFLYLAGFVGNLIGRRSMDSAPEGPFWVAFVVDSLLVALFAVQHSNLLEFHGDTYAAYRRRVPMLIPSLARRVSTDRIVGADAPSFPACTLRKESLDATRQHQSD